MKIHLQEQGTLAWLALRIGKVTASEMGNLMTPEFELRKGEMPKSYLAEKLAEAWRGKPLPAFGSWATDQGLLLEEEAKPWFALEYNCKIRSVGFIEHDDGLSGCSPDGLIDQDCGLEIKSPSPEMHVKYLLNGVVPKDYVAQVHGSMFVTGYPHWIFCSYRRGFPAFVIEVKRDEEIMAKIGEAVAKFHVDFEAGKKRIAEYVK